MATIRRALIGVVVCAVACGQSAPRRDRIERRIAAAGAVVVGPPDIQQTAIGESASWELQVFRAGEPRNAWRDMGYEVAANVRTHLSGPLNLDTGVAVAHLGQFFGTDPKKTYEVFSRLQLQY